MTEKKNTELWDRVSQTNPEMTKSVSQRGGFTAIDAYSQIECATKEFGPVGEGWGWEVLSITYPPNNCIMVHAALWRVKRENRFDVIGMKKLGSDERPDEDCVKKALTDAITKGLSYLGFNADVFTGKFDDNKYVDAMRKKFAPWQGPLKKVALRKSLTELSGKVNKVVATSEMNHLVKEYQEVIDQALVDLPVAMNGDKHLEGDAAGDIVGLSNDIKRTRGMVTFMGAREDEIDNAESSQDLDVILTKHREKVDGAREDLKNAFYAHYEKRQEALNGKGF